MKSSTIALFAAGASASLVARDAATVVSDIKGIQGQVQGLASAVSSYSSFITDAQPLIDAEMKLSQAIEQGTSDAKATSGPVSIADTNSVLSAVANLIPDIVSALNAVVTKYPKFNDDNIGSIVAADLVSLKSSTDAFAAALVAIAPAEGQDSANAAVSCIDAAFVAAQATQSADAGCAAAVTTISGGGETTSSGGPTPTTTESSSSATPTGTVSSTETSTSTSTGNSTPTSTQSIPVGTGTGYPYPTTGYPTGLPWSNSGASVKVGVSAAVVIAALAMVL